jgi:glucose-1-phosphate thymidylyltransferase
VSGPFLVYPGDNLLKGSMAPCLRHFAEARPDALVVLKEDEDPTTFGVVVFDQDGRL